MSFESEYERWLRATLTAGDRLTDAQIRQLLITFNDLNQELKVIITETWAQDLNVILAEVDAAVARAASEIAANGLAAHQEAWFFGDGMMQSFIDFGTEVEAGVGAAGRAWYAPETLAPYPGFAIQPLSASQEAMRAFTFDRITAVTTEMRTRIRTEVIAGYLGESTPYAVMQNITHIHGIRSHWYFRELGASGVSSKAENIFRTEIMTAQNQAGHIRLLEAKETFPDMMKVWFSNGDWRTRDSHLEAHGQEVPVDQAFYVGGEYGMFPLDPALPLRERARCRCRDLPYRASWGPTEELWGETGAAVQAEKDARAEGIDTRPVLEKGK